MDIPESLAHRIELFRSSGKVFKDNDELFHAIAWQQVMIGQRLMPEDYHPLAHSITSEQLEGLLGDLKTLIGNTVLKLPSHSQFLQSQ